MRSLCTPNGPEQNKKPPHSKPPKEKGSTPGRSEGVQRFLEPLRPCLTKSQWQNLVLLVIAVQISRSLILHQLARALPLGISCDSGQRRLDRVLHWNITTRKHSLKSDYNRRWRRLQQQWVRTVVRCFTRGRGALVILLDWTLHQDRCRSLWVMLPVKGRAIPLAFWVAPLEMGGAGCQRKLEDEALEELKKMLPRHRKVVLVGDRGFRGKDRMRFLEKQGWKFILRVTGDTTIQTEEGWQTLEALRPEVGGSWKKEQVLYGKMGPAFQVNLVAVRQALLMPKVVRTNKGKKTGQTVEETTWFLATNLDLRIDVVAIYAWRMKIEETFRDYKAVWGMEKERMQEPWKTLGPLLWALMISMALDMLLADPEARAPERLPRCASSAPQNASSCYPGQSETQEGLHQFLFQLITGQSLFAEELQAIRAKSETMRQRPQVQNRRRSQPALRSRTKKLPASPEVSVNLAA